MSMPRDKGQKHTQKNGELYLNRICPSWRVKKYLNLQEGTDRMSRNVDTDCHSRLRKFQDSADLIYIAKHEI